MDGCIDLIFRLLNKMLLNVLFDFCLNVMCNLFMHQDAQLIAWLGGASKFAERLGFSVQRVQNWKDRGISAHVERDHQWITDERRAMAATTTQLQTSQELAQPSTSVKEVSHG